MTLGEVRAVDAPGPATLLVGYAQLHRAGDPGARSASSPRPLSGRRAA